jgi:tetratricopeptide (TPR) repeat protein
VKRCLFLAVMILSGGVFITWGNPGTLQESDDLIESGRYAECIRALEQDLARATAPARKVELCWRLSQAWYFMAEQDRNRTGDKALVSRGNVKGAAYASDALKLDNRSVMALFWRAANWASWAQQNANIDALSKVGSAREDLLRAIALKPDFTDAYYALGSIYAEVPGWPLSFGNREVGISLMRRAIDTIGARKEAIRGYISLASALWERNWDSATRNARRVRMKKDFDNRTIPAEKYGYYEGVMDFTLVRDYAVKPLSVLIDREEARIMLEFAEKQIPRIVPSAEEQDALRHSVKRTRDKWK